MAPRERILASEHDPAGAPIVLTTYALYYRRAPHPATPSDEETVTGWRRLPWEEIGRVRAHPDGLELTTFADGVAVRIPTSPGSRLEDLVRERVAATDLVGVRIALTDGRSALVAARRRPATGEAVWVVLLPAGIDPDDPDVRLRVDRAIHTVRAQY